MNLKTAFAISLFLPVYTLSTSAAEKAHVHGVAKITFALETKNKGEVDFDIPADSIFGFEHEAKTSKDKTKVEESLKTLREKASEIVIFPSEAKCNFSEAKAETEAESPTEHHSEKHSGHHADVAGGFKFTCENPIAGADISIGLFKLFPKVKKVSFEVIGDANQLKKEVKSAKEVISLSVK